MQKKQTKNRNPPPSLMDETNWSSDFVDFVRECLIKEYEERPVSIMLVCCVIVSILNSCYIMYL